MADIDLVAEISSSIRQAHTQALDISFNELADMVANDELNISPDYQRLFRWSEGQRSRLIESLLLEMPVPPIFVIEEEDGHYQLIDGLQRISSYLHLRGLLHAPWLDPQVHLGDHLKLVDCDIIPMLNGMMWEDLPTSLQIRLKRSFIRVEVVRKESDKRFKYHMFKRLNTGGDRLSDQQIRNATIRMLSNEMPDFLKKLSAFPDYQQCVSNMTQERRLSAIDEELVLRFFALKNWRPKFKHEVGEFLTEYMEGVAEGKIQFNYAAEELVFANTFSVLNASLGDLAFSYWNKKSQKVVNGFGIYHFEATTIALQSVIDKLDAADEQQMQKLKQHLMDAKADQTFIDMTTGGGKNSPGPLNERIAYIEKVLVDAFGG